MDIYIDRDELSRGLARVQGVIERRSTHPTLSHVLLHARDSGLRLTATDTEVAFIGDLSSNTTAEGRITVEAQKLFQIIRAMPEATVRLQATSNRTLQISSGRSRFELPGGAAEDFPSLPAFEQLGSVRIAEGELLRLIEQTHFAVATEDVRYGLNGVHMEERTVDGERRLRFVATDGHRLSSSEAAVEGELHLTPRMLVPRKALLVMKKLLGRTTDPVELAFGEGAVRLTLPSQTFWFRLLDGDFPDYEAVVPNDNKVFAVLDRAALLAALRRVAIVVSERSRAVRFGFTEDALTIQVNQTDAADMKEDVPLELEGSPITVGFNPRYLQDILTVLEGPRVRLSLAHPLAPCLVEDVDTDAAFFVVMPMRLD